jgi:hypothetical protein
MAELLTEPATLPNPDAVGVLQSEASIDQLLDEAENLATQIAEAVQLEGEGSPVAGSIQPAVEAQVLQTEPDTPQSGAIGEASTIPHRGREEVEAAVPAEAAAEEPIAKAPSAESDAEQTEAITSSDTSPQAEAQPPVAGTEPPIADVQSLKVAPTQPSSDESTIAVQILPRRSIGRRILAGFVWTALIPVRIFVTVLAILDRPFARLSALTKERIGYAAIATLLMASLARALPGMMKNNPYEHITDFPAAATAEGEGEAPASHESAEEKPSGEHGGGH